MCEVVMAGRMIGDPIELSDGTTHFLFEAEQDQDPFHCFCEAKAAENLRQYCQTGDEFSLEGKLAWKSFDNEPKPLLLINVRYVSYGRKKKTLR